MSKPFDTHYQNSVIEVNRVGPKRFFVAVVVCLFFEGGGWGNRQEEEVTLHQRQRHPHTRWEQETGDPYTGRVHTVQG